MVVVSYSGKEINAKLVYYGAGLSGKTTNLEAIYEAVPESSRGKMVSMKTQSDRTLFFDLLPLDLGEIMGYKTRFLLYTVPGQVFYNATRKLVLKGADAIVFVADSAIGKMEENKESLANLKANLSEYGVRLEDLPFVLQYNKRDLPNVYSIEEMNAELNPEGTLQVFEAVATQGVGVFETFRGISHLLMQKVTRELRRSSHGGRSSRTEEAEPRTAPGAPAAPPAQRPAATTPSRLMPAFEAPPSGAGPAMPAPPAAPVAKQPATARPPEPAPELDYGRSVGLDAGTETGAAKAGKNDSDIESAFHDEPLTVDRMATAQSRKREPAAPAVSSAGERAIPAPSGGYERTLTLDAPEKRAAGAQAAATDAAEVIVPVKLPRGTRCEIVLRIVIQDGDHTSS